MSKLQETKRNHQGHNTTRPVRRPRRMSAARDANRRRAAAAVTAVACAVALAACGSSSGGSANASSNSGGSASATASSSSTVTVAVGKVSGYGSVLTSSGRPVYILSTDPSGSSKCSGSCAKVWKPLTVSGSPAAGSGVTSSLLSTFKRSDGSTQVLYNKHALYTHSGSAATAAGTASDGGVWYLINAKGAAVKSTSAGGY
jgi:predicted lipoprotein with Yx(FWY)xxD motif